MNILEAKRLAEQGETVVSPIGQEWTARDFEYLAKDENGVTGRLLFGEWRKKTDPMRAWVNVCTVNGYVSIHISKEDAEENKNNFSRVVEFVEVIK